MFRGKFVENKLEGLVHQSMSGHSERLFLKDGRVFLLKHHAINSEIK